MPATCQATLPRTHFARSIFPVRLPTHQLFWLIAKSHGQNEREDKPMQVAGDLNWLNVPARKPVELNIYFQGPLTPNRSIPC